MINVLFLSLFSCYLFISLTISNKYKSRKNSSVQPEVSQVLICTDIANKHSILQLSLASSLPDNSGEYNFKVDITQFHGRTLRKWQLGRKIMLKAGSTIFQRHNARKLDSSSPTYHCLAAWSKCFKSQKQQTFQFLLQHSFL